LFNINLGLIFQPVDEKYTAGRCDSILKWKPPSMNSVDFKLQITIREEIGMLPEKIGELYVGGYDQPFSHIKINRNLSSLHNRIIECRWHEGKWDFMRERTDKSDPNYITTAQAVCESIRNPVTEEFLINSIQHIENHRKQHQFLAPLPPNLQSHQATTSNN
jgi:mRNA-capping enzyme